MATAQARMTSHSITDLGEATSNAQLTLRDFSCEKLFNCDSLVLI